MTRTSTIQTTALSAIGALGATFAALAFTGAVTPVHATTPASAVAPANLTEWRARVEKAIDEQMTVPDNLREGDLRTTRMAIDFDASGQSIGSHLIQSSGHWNVDREAQRIARRVHYPRLPVLMQGKPRQVEMELYFASLPTEDTAHKAVAQRRERTAAVIRKLEATIQQANGGRSSPVG